jgi:hypothetical protein
MMTAEILIWTIGLLAFQYIFLPAVWRSAVWPQYLAVKWGQASHSWPRVRGEITFAKLKTVGRYGHAAEIWYEYTVDNIDCASNRVALGVFLSTSLDDALATYERYRLGSNIAIYYHPDNPQLAVLVPGVSGVRVRFGYLIITLAIGLVLVTLAALMACMSYLLKI